MASHAFIVRVDKHYIDALLHNGADLTLNIIHMGVISKMVAIKYNIHKFKR
jgi:hypothetical protein